MSTTHPHVGAYLDDRARMLADVDPCERDDILASVREHLDAEISAGDGSDAVVHAALFRLGPPEQVAAEARAGTATGAAPLVPAGESRGLDVPSPSGPNPWARVAVVTTLLATVPLLLLTLVSRTWTTGRGGTGAGWPDEMSVILLAGVAALIVASARSGWRENTG